MGNNKMIESLLNEIFLKKDGKTAGSAELAGDHDQASGTGVIYRPNYQRSRSNPVTNNVRSFDRETKSGVDLNVFEMMRKYTR